MFLCGFPWPYVDVTGVYSLSRGPQRPMQDWRQVRLFTWCSGTNKHYRHESSCRHGRHAWRTNSMRVRNQINNINIQMSQNICSNWNRNKLITYYPGQEASSELEQVPSFIMYVRFYIRLLKGQYNIFVFRACVSKRCKYGIYMEIILDTSFWFCYNF